MGMRIAMTGLVVFCFCLLMASIAKAEPKQHKTYCIFGLLMLAGMFAVPAGLILSIWE